MHAAVRPYVTAGVALFGASVIAVTPVAPAPPDIRIATPVVQLMAAPNPIDFYPQVVQTTLNNAGTLLKGYLLVGYGLIQEAVTRPVPLLVSAFEVLFYPSIWSLGAKSAISPVLNGVGATGVALTDVVKAVQAFDPVDLFNAVVDIPARIADGVLNGGYPSGSGLAVGLFTPGSLWLAVPGPIGFPIVVAQMILMNTAAVVNSGVTPADQGLAKAGADTAAQAQQGLDTVAVAAGNATDGLAKAAQEEVPDQAEGQALGTAPRASRTETLSSGTDLTDGNMVTDQAEDQALGTARRAATAETLSSATDLTDGDMVKPGQAPTTNPTERGTGIRHDLQRRVATHRPR